MIEILLVILVEFLFILDIFSTEYGLKYHSDQLIEGNLLYQKLSIRIGVFYPFKLMLPLVLLLIFGFSFGYFVFLCVCICLMCPIVVNNGIKIWSVVNNEE